MIHTFHDLGLMIFGVFLGFIIGQLCKVWEVLEDLAKGAEWQALEDSLEETRRELEDWRKNVDDLMEGRVPFEVMREIYLNGKGNN